MAPPNDDIANAISISGASGSTTGDNTGATLEANEATCLGYESVVNRFYRDFYPYTDPPFGYGGGRTVWWKWTCPADGFYKFDTSASGGSPIVDSILAIILGTDFTTAQLGGPDDNGAIGTYSALTIYAIAGLTYYIAVDGYNGYPTDDPLYLITNTAEGTFTLTWGSGIEADAQIYSPMVRIIDDYNTGSSTTSVVTNTRQELRDIQIEIDTPSNQWSPDEATDSFYIQGRRLPLPGYYKVEYKHAESAAGTISTNVAIIGVLNGLPIISDGFFVGYTFNDLSRELTNATNAFPYGPWVMPIVNSDDVLTFRISTEGTVAGLRRMDFYAIKFTPVAPIAPAQKPSLWKIDDLMLGATTVPISLQTTFSNVHDLCVTANGDIYVLMDDYAGVYPNQKDVIKLQRFSGGAWTVLSADVAVSALITGNATLPDDAPAIAIDTNGTDVFLAFGWPDGTMSATPPTDGTSAGTHQNWMWHCVKYDGSFTELGTGQRNYPPVAGVATMAGRGSEGIQLKVGPDGKVWVAWSERDTSYPGSYVFATFSRGFIAEWSGSAWTIHQPPDPPNMYSATAFIVDHVLVDDQRHIDLTFCHSDGPSNWPSIMYEFDLYPNGVGPRIFGLLYSEFNGSTWGNTIQIYLPDIFTELTYAIWTQGVCLIDNGVVPYFSAAAGSGPRDSILVGRVNGSSLEPYAGHGYPSKVVGQWEGPTSSEIVFAGSTLMLANDTLGGGPNISVAEEIGTGQGWHVAANKNFVNGVPHIGFSRMFAIGSTVYIIETTRGFNYYNQDFLGVWKITPYGPISVYGLTPWR